MTARNGTSGRGRGGARPDGQARDRSLCERQRAGPHGPGTERPRRVACRPDRVSSLEGHQPGVRCFSHLANDGANLRVGVRRSARPRVRILREPSIQLVPQNARQSRTAVLDHPLDRAHDGSRRDSEPRSHDEAGRSFLASSPPPRAPRSFPTALPRIAGRGRIDPTNPTHAGSRTHPGLLVDARRRSDEIVIVAPGRPIDRSRLVCPYWGLTRALVRLGKGVEARR